MYLVVNIFSNLSGFIFAWPNVWNFTSDFCCSQFPGGATIYGLLRISRDFPVNYLCY